MKILITNHSLESLGGTERSVIELAKELKKRGHEVVACSSQIGEAGRMMKESAMTVIKNPFETTFKPDLIHGQHHLDAMRAIAAFPNTPAIYYCHGYFPWVEDAPYHPRITHYLGMCDSITEKMKVNTRISSTEYVTVSNWFDDSRFKYAREPQKTPKKALFFHRSFDRQSSFAQELVKVFKTNGIELDLNLATHSSNTPELILNQYDIVLASGRSAIEAMAAGCAVMPVSDQAILEFVNLDNFEVYKKQNFSPLASTPHFNIQYISDCIQKYDAHQVKLVCQKIRSENTLTQTAIQLEKIYIESINKFNEARNRQVNNLENELEAFSKYIQTIMPLVREHGKLTIENQALKNKNDLMNQEIQRVHQSFSMRLTKPIRLINQWRLKLKSSF
jgi:hypothetical protein